MSKQTPTRKQGKRMCRKHRYADELGAMIALASTYSKDRSARRNEVRVYHCPLCRGWHLTAMGRR